MASHPITRSNSVLTPQHFPEIMRTKRNLPPQHYSIRINQFSLLAEKQEKYESFNFEAGGHKWKLWLYPKGNKTSPANVRDHVSLYSVIQDTESLPKHWEVNVDLKLFVYDQAQDKYLTVQDLTIKRFNEMKTVWGFDRFLSLEAFNDACNGYLVDDFCVFGAEVFTIKPSGIYESVHASSKCVVCENVESSGTSGTVEGNESCRNNPFPDAKTTIQRNIFNAREELKKTYEYKRAIEEEWAARQLKLKIQAEEAQRLRRKIKAEKIGISDIERRQKRRLEEVRANREKDAEILNMKEIFRTEVRKEICQLEMECVDMVSLLRRLGIHVNGGLQPTPHEVREAYKQALLKFHPDRSSRTHLRQQVEAEEKFKLISRMKEKFT